MNVAEDSFIAVESHIIHDPAIVGGEAVVLGTRIPVRCIVQQFQLYQDVGRVQAAYPRLTPQLIHEALAYYAGNRDEIDRAILENQLDD